MSTVIIAPNYETPYPYLPPHKRDTRYDLWYPRYKVRVANIQARSIEDIIENGSYISGEEDFDHMAAWTRELRMINIVRMATLWNQKANIYLSDVKDSKKIYDAISKHLIAWRIFLTGSYNTVIKPPVDDLLLLDQFASMIYEHAKWHFDDEFTSKFLRSKKLFRFSRRHDDDARAKLLAVKEQEEANRAKETGVVETNNFKLHVVNVGETKKTLDTDFSNKPRYDTDLSRQHRSMTDYLK